MFTLLGGKYIKISAYNILETIHLDFFLLFCSTSKYIYLCHPKNKEKIPGITPF
jgi:hypothetical protein